MAADAQALHSRNLIRFVFENPASDGGIFFGLKLRGWMQVFRLQNRLGHTEISRREIIKSEEITDIGQIPGGVYFVTIEDADRLWVSKRVVQR